MQRHNNEHRKDPTGQREREESLPSPPPVTGKSLARREAALLDREESADLRQRAADRRQETADLREEAANLRQETARLRQKALRTKRKTAQAKAKLCSRTEKLLRDANEQLVVASIHAQTMTETAQQIALQMAHMAEHDFLTGLPNRVLLNDRLERSIALAQRQGKKVALMYMDIDHFKHINDSHGHMIGDQLLQSIAGRLHASIRLSDTVSRHGGDEFIVMLSDVENPEDATDAAQKLIETMAEPHLIGIHRLHVTLSIGISLYPDDCKDMESLFTNADTALYHAKKKGRNNYQMFTPDMKVHAKKKQSVKQALHRALELSKFILHYQPKVNLKTGAITGVEALLRWQRSNDRLAYPAQFVSIAEDSGLIEPIGRWVLGEACRQAKAWLQAGLDFGQIAVNVSAVEFQGKDFLPGVRNILTDTGLDPRHLTFELTESAMMQNTQQTMETLQDLKDLGIKIAIDDFGTGYSSLSYLRSFPIDEIKIDQSFVQDIDGDTGNTIVSAVIAIGKSLKQRVVAEGIETQKQLSFLQARHCAEGQGYYFGRPVTAKEFTSMLADGAH
ncbi:MAG: EAL domain-containing protein [Smithellaceae bacterium]